MKIIGIILAVIGVLGLHMSLMMYGDIGVAGGIGSFSALLSGIGFIKLTKVLEELKLNHLN